MGTLSHKIPHLPALIIISAQEHRVLQGYISERQEGARLKGRKDQSETDDESKREEYDRIGVLGEYAVAKYLGVFWNGGVNNPTGCDIIGKIEVKITPRLTNTHLRVPLNAPDEYVYVLTTVRGRMDEGEQKIQIEGWIDGKRAKRFETGRFVAERNIDEHLVHWSKLEFDPTELFKRVGRARERLSRRNYRRERFEDDTSAA